MTKEEKDAEVRRLKMEENTAKERLGRIQSDLLEMGAVREANTLFTIICKLETWQNK